MIQLPYVSNSSWKLLPKAKKSSITTGGMMLEGAYATTMQRSMDPAGDTVLIEGSNNPSADALRTERDFVDEGS
jgi:hypothetical protein